MAGVVRKRSASRRSLKLPVTMLCAVMILCVSGAAQVQIAAKAEGPVAMALSDAHGKAAGDEGPIRGPLLGYIFDASALRLRPLLGIPGASYVGNPLQVGFTPEYVEISPSHQYAIGVEAETHEVFLIDLRSPMPSAARIPGVSAGAGRAFFSPLGNSVALYYRQEKQVEILTGLPGEPNVEGRVDLASLPGMLTALAVSDDGKTVAAASSEGDLGSLFVAAPGEALRMVGTVGRASALAFFNDADDLLVADAGRSEVVRIRNFSAGAQWTVLASSRDGVEQPLAVSVSRDNATAFAVDASHRIALLPLGGGVVDFLDCACTPTGLNALMPGSVFRLTSAAAGPIYMLDARVRDANVPGKPRVLFIPAADPLAAPADGESTTVRGRVRR